MLTGDELGVVALALAIALQAVGLALLPGLGLALLLARWRSRWRFVVQGLVMLPLVMPPVATGYLLLRLFGRSSAIGGLWEDVFGASLAYSTAAAVLAAAVVGFPLLVESIRLAILGIDPRLETVSRTLGRGGVATFLRVTLPLAAPGIAAGAVLAFARALGEFGATIVFAGSIPGETVQIPLAVYRELGTPGGEGAAWRLTAFSVLLSFACLFAVSRLGASRRRDAEETA